MSGPALPVAYLLFVAGVSAAIVSTVEPGPDGVRAVMPGPEEVRAVIRVTAFTSAIPFLLAFLASPLHRLRRSAASRWLMANRRYVGLSVAASHWWHLVAIVARVRWYAAGAEPTPLLTLVFGGAGFVVLGLMAATSNDASQRLLGRGWTWLHTIGVYVLWIDFIFTYSGAATATPFHALMTLLFAGAWMLRLVAFWVRR